MAIAGAIALVFLIQWYGPPVYNHLRVLDAQRECMLYKPGDAQAVYVAKFMESVENSKEATTAPPTVTATTPAPWLSLTGFAGWTNFGSKAVNTNTAMPLLHEVVLPGGEKRLAVLILEPPSSRLKPALRFPSCRSALLEPATLFRQLRRPSIANHGISNVDTSRVAASGSELRLYAAELDPNDSARFTIRYEIGDSGGTIEGRISAWGISLRVLDGLAAREIRNGTEQRIPGRS